MAKKQSATQAEKIVSQSKKKASTSKTSAKAPKKPVSKKTNAKKQPAVKTEYEDPLSSSALTAIISFFLFLLFLLVSIKPEGALLMVVKSFVLGLIGQAGFYFSIPALFFLFFIHTFGRKVSIKMRSTCAASFVFLCGMIYHLLVCNAMEAEGFSIISELYKGGISGQTGGVFCGGAALLLRWSCGMPLSYLVTILSAVFTLLGAMQITIPSLIRAIANRPRDEWDEEEETYIEPATIVANHIANKKIEQKRQRRERISQEKEETEPVSPKLSTNQKHVFEENNALVQPLVDEKKVEAISQSSEKIANPDKQISAKGAAFMNRVDAEIGVPLNGTSKYVEDPIPDVFEEPVESFSAIPSPKGVEPDIPTRMPELKRNSTASTELKAVSTMAEHKQSKDMDSGKVSSKDAAESAKLVAEEIKISQATQKAEYCFPPIDLLKRPLRGGADGTDEMRENSRRLNETLASFNIDAHIINVTRGPSVTRYEVELDKGVRLNKITGCADDIALSLGASGVRIAAVPGKISVVGIEVPNRTVTTVSLREVIDSGEFAKAKSKSSIALGKSIDGNCVVGNISKMPHLLIAGTTGSGKSVCMNSIIISLLYKAGPEDVKLIMVDPKMVELGIYNGIPHLLIPVVTDPKKAAGSLQWAVTEMLRRYKMMSDLGVRDLESYNSIVVSEEGGQKLPQVVIIIDELADLMMVAAKEVEDSICRIAQMGRAAGMHLIIATQRPSANVITGLMKANIPSRIAFSVASAMESRIILDTMGAEKLVGKGDMLYAPIGSGKPLRVQGCFVTDGEVESVAEYVKENYVADYNQAVLDEIEKKAQQTGKKPSSVSDPDPSDEELEGDEMLPAAVDVILETGQASVSMLQRRLKLGYARAARIVDEMEEKGIVGPFQGSKPRSILITKEQWEAKKNGSGQVAFEDMDGYGAVPEEID